MAAARSMWALPRLSVCVVQLAGAAEKHERLSVAMFISWLGPGDHQRRCCGRNDPVLLQQHMEAMVAGQLQNAVRLQQSVLSLL